MGKSSNKGIFKGTKGNPQLAFDNGSVIDRQKNKNNMPNYAKATIPIEKIEKYILNSNHEIGKHKAKVIKAALGFESKDASEFSLKILRIIHSGTAKPFRLEKSSYGTKYSYEIFMDGKNGKKAIFRVAFQVDNGSDIPRFTSGFVIKKERGRK
ncbi:hypothetical protein FACS189459_7060 [Bacilli bacterium]|nr:hypothetical protein FACS189459_7060 [Bacilli bacterium]